MVRSKKGRGASNALKPMQGTMADGLDLYRRDLLGPSFCICHGEEKVPIGIISAMFAYAPSRDRINHC